jgi:hypothetical protein
MEKTPVRRARGRLSARLGAALLALVCVPAAAPRAAAEAAALPGGEEEVAARTPAPLTPLVREMVRLLEEGLDSPIVRQWAERQNPPQSRLTADDLIALKRAGASEELVGWAIAVAGSRSEAPAPPASVGPASAGRAAPVRESGLATVHLSVDYRAVEPVEGEFEAKSRDLFVYIDGQLVARVASRGDLLRRETPSFEIALEPGEHTLRFMRELHSSRRRERWIHETRVAPEAIRFSVSAGAYWALELTWKESVFGGGGTPLAWRLVRDGEPVDGRADFGTPKERWPLLCEDIEAGLAAGERPSRSVARDLEGCVRWADLWHDGASVPPRSEVLAELVAHGFSPPARTSASD